MEFYIQLTVGVSVVVIIACTYTFLIFFPLLYKGKWKMALLSLLPTAVFGGWLTAVIVDYLLHRY